MWQNYILFDIVFYPTVRAWLGDIGGRGLLMKAERLDGGDL